MRMLLKRVGAWLRAAPIDDPIDRRNAPFVQVLLVFFALFILINKALYLSVVLSGQWQTTRDWVQDASTGALMCVMAGVALWMIRRGSFRWAVSLFLASVMAVMVTVYAVIDVSDMSMQVFPLLVLALGGLVLGRRALRIIVLAQVAIYLLCLVSNLLGFAPGSQSLAVSVGMFVATTGSYLLMAFIVDRAATTLRSNLDESLAQTRRLQKEAAERERMLEQLIHAQKMEVVGRTASGVAHDFDNVLSVILGYTARSQRLADGGVEPLLNAMNGIRTAAEHALQVSGRLLNFSRRDAWCVEVLDLDRVIADAVPMLRQLCGSRVRVHADLPGEQVWICIDQGQLELVLLSIAANARDAMPEGGDFGVTVKPAADGTVTMELSDTGSGIDEAHMAHLFEPFYTTKPAGQGTGLGLSVARDVMVRAGGDITVRNCPGKGAVFTLHLPRADAPAAVDQDVASALPANT